MFFALQVLSRSAIAWSEFSKGNPIVFTEEELQNKVGFVLFKDTPLSVEGTIGSSRINSYSVNGISVSGGAARVENTLQIDRKYVKFAVDSSLCSQKQAVSVTIGSTTKGSSSDSTHKSECYVGIGAEKIQIKLSSQETAVIFQNNKRTDVTKSDVYTINPDLPYSLTFNKQTSSIYSTFNTSGPLTTDDFLICLDKLITHFSPDQTSGKDYFYENKQHVTCDVVFPNPPSNNKGGSMKGIVIAIVVVFFIIAIGIAICAYIYYKKHGNDVPDNLVSQTDLLSEDVKVEGKVPSMNITVSGNVDQKIEPVMPSMNITVSGNVGNTNDNNMNMNVGMNMGVGMNIGMNVSGDANTGAGMTVGMNMGNDMGIGIGMNVNDNSNNGGAGMAIGMNLGGDMNMGIGMNVSGDVNSGAGMNVGMNMGNDMNMGIGMNVSGDANTGAGMNVGMGFGGDMMNMDNMMNMPGAKVEAHYTRTENGKVVEEGHFHN